MQSKLVIKPGVGGGLVAVLLIDGERVQILAQDRTLRKLNGQPMGQRFAVTAGRLLGDGVRTVQPGALGYAAALVDLLERHGFYLQDGVVRSGKG